jgi:hypothetical protein
MSIKKRNTDQILQLLSRSFTQRTRSIALALCIVLGISIVIPIGTDIYQHWHSIDPEERSQTGINFIQTAATIIGGIAVFWNIVISRQQLAAFREQSLTERFSIAVEQLGHEQIAVRIGGIYSLERVAQDSSRDYWTVIEILAAFIRERRNWIAWEDLPEKPDIDKDITPAIIVLGRCDRTRQPPDSPIYLQSCDFRRCAFISDDFRDTIFQDSHFGQANLYGSNFRGSNFRKSNFTEANLKNADLSSTNLTQAKLNRADVTNCNFQGADISEADLSQAKGLTLNQVKSAHNWQTAIYDDDFMKQLGLNQN